MISSNIINSKIRNTGSKTLTLMGNMSQKHITYKKSVAHSDKLRMVTPTFSAICIQYPKVKSVSNDKY